MLQKLKSKGSKKLLKLHRLKWVNTHYGAYENILKPI